MSTSSTSSSSAASTYFNGQSQFSADLQNVITRSIGIATLPITQLQNDQSNLTTQQSEIQTLGSDFQTVQSAVDSLNSSLGTSSYGASVDTPAVATANISTGVLVGTYSLNVTNIGSQTNTISAAGSSVVTDPTSKNISSASTFSLTVDGKNYSLTPTGASLDSLVSAINNSGAAVQATVVNVGGSSSPDYRLSVQSTQYAPDTIQLNDGTNNLLSSLSTGAYVQYQVNGQPSTPVTSTSRTLSLSTGLTATVNTVGTANITVAQNSSSISTALTNLVSAYNTASDELTKNRGQNGGGLSGNSLVSDLQSALNSIATFTSASAGSVNSLASLGVGFDQDGHLQFDQATFQSTAATSLSGVLNFLGSETGGGFIQAAYNTLTSLTDSTSGIITQAGNNIGKEVTSLTSQIAAKQDQVTLLQNNLTAEMAQADAAISSLQSQVTEITNLFTAETQAQKNITG